MRILITGGAGYVGSQTAKYLAQAGFEPIVLDNLSVGHRWAVKWGPLVEADLADKEMVRKAMREHRVRAVIHFAARAYVAESMSDPRAYLRDNVINALNVLDSMAEEGVRYVIFSSTCATYGVPRQIPTPEHHPQFPINPYGEGKLFLERVLKWYGAAYGLRWIALRYFNAAGADPEGDLGEDHDPEPHLIPRAIQAALCGAPCVEIFGTDYPTPDGTAMRDYIHVLDLAKAHYLALVKLMRGAESAYLNLGAGKSHSVRDILAAVEREVGRRVPIRESGRRPGDPPLLAADTTHAQHVLDWQPTHSSLEEIVGTAVRWEVEFRSRNSQRHPYSLEATA